MLIFIMNWTVVIYGINPESWGIFTKRSYGTIMEPMHIALPTNRSYGTNDIALGGFCFIE